MMEYRDVVKKIFQRFQIGENFGRFFDGPVSEMVLSGHIDKAKKR